MKKIIALVSMTLLTSSAVAYPSYPTYQAPSNSFAHSIMINQAQNIRVNIEVRESPRPVVAVEFLCKYTPVKIEVFHAVMQEQSRTINLQTSCGKIQGSLTSVIGPFGSAGVVHFNGSINNEPYNQALLMWPPGN